ncbi:hypothetical protein scyTo_0000677 [Scyliorhinus torazame]|uniref:Uncharacterized protein n=1 Tax=Scyliorhinus torazame TaxID=75743 RepID=A0A401P1T5_SCYTO|nr:hypothetical protein [Scyliorhinus torazame]
MSECRGPPFVVKPRQINALLAKPPGCSERLKAETQVLEMRIIEQIAIYALLCVFHCVQGNGEQSQTVYFLPEFALSPQGSFLEDTTGEQVLTYRYDDQVGARFPET